MSKSTKKITYPLKQVDCPVCDGTGVNCNDPNDDYCQNCGGTGKIKNRANSRETAYWGQPPERAGNMSKMIEVTCPECKRSRQMRLSNFERGKRTGLCLVCFNLKRTKEACGLHDGYVLVKYPSHPRANYFGFVKRAIFVMENKLGRHLLPTEHIHHINGIRDDDRPDNLTILTNSEHARLHGKSHCNLKNRYQMASEAKAF